MSASESKTERDMQEAAPKAGDLVYRHRWSTRLWHWLNALTVFMMLMSGLMIFNAHPRLYWGKYGANFDHAWLKIGGGADGYAFPGWATLPGIYDLAGAREWHFAFAWLLVVPGILYLLWSFADRHVQRDLAPSAQQLKPKSVWHSIKEHALLNLPAGAAALHYNVLQKISYLAVLFLLLPLMVLTGLTMSPGIDAAWPWLLDLFGGRQSARSIHFIIAMIIVAFIAVHLVMVVLAGPFNELRSMITGRYRLPKKGLR